MPFGTATQRSLGVYERAMHCRPLAGDIPHGAGPHGRASAVAWSIASRIGPRHRSPWRAPVSRFPVERALRGFECSCPG